MKKIIPVLIMILLLTSCGNTVKDAKLEESFTANAVYKHGDYSYSCKITKGSDYVSITPTSTNAKGMLIKCNGKTVEFVYDGFSKSSDINKIDITNPARILYEVFFCGKTKGNTSVGAFELTCEKKKPVFINIPAADISVSFK